MKKHLLCKFILILVFLSICNTTIVSQLAAQNVAVTDDDLYTAESSAMLDVKSLNKGMLIPRLDSTQRKNISNPALGLLVFDKSLNSFMYYNGLIWIGIPHMNATAGSGTALFAVANAEGDTIFAVYNDGVKVTVSDGAKGTVGGFAVSGRTPTKLGEEFEYFRVTPDSTRVYINDTLSGKGMVGGFAVSGRTPTKSFQNNYFLSTPDSTRVYVNDESLTKGTVGGFAVSGRTPTKGTSVNFLDLTPDNYFIGHESGIKTTGLYNTFFGYKAGRNNTTGSRNVFIGDSTGYSNTSGYRNLFMGYHAGYANYSGMENIIIGYRAGYSNYGGGYNTFVGNSAGSNNTSGTYNVFMGVGAGGHNTTTGFLTMIGVNAGHFTLTGQGNVFLGCNAGWIHENGGNNTFIGTDAGRGGNVSGDYNPSSPSGAGNTFVGTNAGRTIEGANNNVAIGVNAGYYVGNGSGNVFIGNNAGTTSTVDDRLYIANSSGTPLIYGDFFLSRVGLGTMNPLYKLDVVGDINVTGSYKIGGTSIISSQWTTSGSNIYYNIGNVAIGTTPDATYKLKVNGNLNIIGAVSATSFSGSLTGNVNGVSMTIINLNGDGVIASINNFDLVMSGNMIWLQNNSTNQLSFWYNGKEGTNTVGRSGEVLPEDKYLIAEIADDFWGYEIHFGDSQNGTTFCSVWIQFNHGRVVGHCIKY
ncbi:MAG: hypothetical protein A2W99_09415 [Bacteroidetes bacterium GWF2_33_16]|nr:MAG: hypothetical protein A2X00_06325 [Bacteroidetes bacterium GWE2_32_14]OFY07215.1 MAG: hypothetical protein A2W99_09415 [Bacteroidetes bacterium GWF2_33_16]